MELRILTPLALTLAVVGTWVILTLGLCAIGVLFLNRHGGIEPTWYNAYCSVWTGYALLIASLMFWNFFLAVNNGAMLTFASVAVLSLIVERKWFASLLRLPISRSFAAAVALFTLWAANHALAGASMDDYLYEFQAVRWFHDYPVVRGLANLHGRIGFNNSHHLFAAMMSTGIWMGAVNHIFNGLFVVLASILLLYSVADLAKGAKGSLDRSRFPALLLCPVVGLVSFGPLGPMISSLKADVFVAAATATLACLFLSCAATLASANRSRFLASSAATLVMGAVVPSVKPSALVFSGFIVAAVILMFLFDLRLGPPAKRMLAASAIVVAALAISVPIRGVVLSGYPFYPSTALGIDVDWRVPLGLAEADHAMVTSFARLVPTYDPHKVSGWLWVRDWARYTATTDQVNIVLPLILTLACLPLLFVPRRGATASGEKESAPGWAYITLMFASIASLVVWFVEAPAGRFAIVTVWILFASVFSWAAQRQLGRWVWMAPLAGLTLVLPIAAFALLHYLQISGEERVRILILFAFAASWLILLGFFGTGKPGHLAALCISLAFYQYGERSVEYFLSKDYSNLRAMLWIDIYQLKRPWPPAPTSLRQTRSGLTIYETILPTYETPLPNTRYFNPFLQLRTTRMQDGFRNVAGDSVMSTVYDEGDYGTIPRGECEMSLGFLEAFYKMPKRNCAQIQLESPPPSDPSGPKRAP